jgi:Cu/Ag efflux pump CusA
MNGRVSSGRKTNRIGARLTEVPRRPAKHRPGPTKALAVAIFYFSEYHSLLEHGKLNSRSALIEAGKNRMRPIVMTTLATILTLLRLEFAIGRGASVQEALAVAFIAGLVVQLPLVLFVMPVLYHFLRGRRASEVNGVLLGK